MLKKSITISHELQQSLFHSPSCILDQYLIEKYIQLNCPKLLAFFEGLSNLYLLYNDASSDEFRNRLTPLILGISLPSNLQMKECHQNTSQIAYHCECMLKETSRMCSDCFLPEKHQDHCFRMLQNEGESFCDCGNLNNVRADVTCSKHQTFIGGHNQLGEDESKALVSQYRVLLSLAMSLRMREVGINHKDEIFSEVFVFFQNAVEMYAGMHIVIEDVLLSQIDEVFLGYSMTLLELLIRSQAWPQKIRSKIINLLCRLGINNRLPFEAIKIWLRLAHRFNDLDSFSLLIVERIISNAYIASLKEQQEDELASPCYVRCLVSVHQHKEVTALIRQFMVEVHRKNPSLFSKLTSAFVKHVPLSYWFCKQHQFVLYNKDEAFIYCLFSSLKEQPCSQNQVLLLSLMRSSLMLIATKQATIADCMVLVFSILNLFNFNLQALALTEPQKLRQMLDQQNLEGVVLNTEDYIHLYLGLVKVKNYNQRYVLAIIYLTVKILMLIHQKIIGKSFLEQQLHSLMSSDEVVEKVIGVSDLVKSYIFVSQSSFPEAILQNKLHTGELSASEKGAFFDIMIMNPGYSKKELKQQIGRNGFNNEEHFKTFMKQCYEESKVQMANKRLNFRLSFNSTICYCENSNEKTYRFRNSIARTSDQGIQLISRAQCAELVSLYPKLMEVSNEGEQEGREKFKEAVNELFELYLTIYLGQKTPEVEAVLVEMNSNREVLQALSRDNKELLFALHQFIQKKEQQGVAVGRNKERLRTKKEKMMKEIKAKQQRALEHLGNDNVQEAEKEEFACIICQQGEQIGQLMYLTHLKYSTVLTNSVLHQEEGFFLFTTCGHLIHEDCLVKSLTGNKNFGVNYNCFLCRKFSNIRVPLNYSADQQTRARAFYEQMQTVVGLQRQSLGENTKGQSSEVEKQLQKSHKSMFRFEEEEFRREIYRSIFYEIYLYFLNDCQMFNYYIFPLLPSLLELVRWHSVQKGEIIMKERGLADSTKIARKINKNIDYFIAGKHHKFAEGKFDQEEEVPIEESDSQYRETKREINKVFRKMAGGKGVQFKAIRNVANFKINRLPVDLLHLKKMAGVCPDCKKMTDNLRLCMLCDRRGCLGCREAWNSHLYCRHGGVSASLTVRGGFILYEAQSVALKQNPLYRNYLGDYYSPEECPGSLNEGDYVLDETYYERVVEDLVLGKVETAVEEFQRERSENRGCQIQ